MMKTIWAGLACVVAGHAALAQKQATVTGTLAVAAPGNKVYLETNNSPAVRLDSAVLGTDKRFSLKTSVPEGGNIYLLTFSGPLATADFGSTAA